jgi:hypothetical protein
MTQLPATQETIVKILSDLESREGARCSRLDFVESELNSFRPIAEEQHEQLKVISEIVRAHEERFGRLDSDHKALQHSAEEASASQTRNSIEQEATRKMVNEIRYSNEERFAEVTSTQTRLRESIEMIDTIVRKELKKLKTETPAGPASGPRSQHFPFSGAPLKGIIAFLTEKYKGNVIDKGIVKILAGKPTILKPNIIFVMLLTCETIQHMLCP